MDDAVSRQAAQEKGLDDFLQHVKQQSSPAIGRQIDCIIQRWQQLDAQQQDSTEEEGGDASDAELDDDPQDAHSHVGSGSDEAETIHSWGEQLGDCILRCTTCLTLAAALSQVRANISSKMLNTSAQSQGWTVLKRTIAIKCACFKNWARI